MKAIYNRARICPKKVNLVAGIVRGKKAIDAEDMLKFMPKKAAAILLKTLKSAMANAVNNLAQEKKNLMIKSILVTEAPTYKRGIPISKGRMHPILKRNANITIELGIDEKAIVEKVKTSESMSTEVKTEATPVKTKKTSPIKSVKRTKESQSS